MSKKVVIVGGVAAGASVAARYRRLDEQATITMLERGPVVSFSNCCLPYHLSGIVQTAEELVLMTPEKFKLWFNIDAQVNSEVTSINPRNKTVNVYNPITQKRTQVSYDVLVVSPGSDAVIPPFEGLEDIPHFSLKTVDDAARTANFVRETKPKHITVIGGGFIGLEAAENLRKTGVQVTLVEAGAQIIPFLDPEIAALGQAEMIRNGIEVKLNTKVTRFDSNHAYFSSGESIETDGVMLAIGVKPATDFLRSSGMAISEHGSIVVDTNYQTTLPDVYAAGDAILVKNGITDQSMTLAMAGPANKQGRLIADRIAGRKILNKGYIGSNVVRLFDLNIAATGMTERMLAATNIDYDVVYAAPPGIVSLMPGAHSVMSKLVFEKTHRPHPWCSICFYRCSR